MENSPFDLDNESAYRAWRDAKLAAYPRSVDELIVPLADPRHLTPDEIAALEVRCARANMAIYSAPHLPAADKSIPKQLAQQLGLRRNRLEGTIAGGGAAQSGHRPHRKGISPGKRSGAVPRP